MNRIAGKTAVLGLIATMALTGCGGSSETSRENSGNTASPSRVPVTIRAAVDGIIVADDLVKLFQDAVKAKQPHITLEVIQPGQGTKLQDLIVSGSVPDLILTFNGNLASYRDQGLLFDITPLLKPADMDLNAFNEGTIADLKIDSPKGELYGLPYLTIFHALYYNKDIFDKFGVAYPKDGMTWEQAIDLARKTTRLDNGVQYRGLDTGTGPIWPAQPLGLSVVEAKMNKASVNNDGWKRVFELMGSIYKIPGNAPVGSFKNVFVKEKRLAMIGGTNYVQELAAASDELKWDVVQYPSYSDKPNIHGNSSSHLGLVTQAGKNKEQAMLVLKAITSVEAQTALSKTARVPILKDASVRQAFAADLAGAKGKNLQGIFKSKPGNYPPSSEFRAKAETIVQAKFKDYIEDKVDVNSALRSAEEEINKMIETETKK